MTVLVTGGAGYIGSHMLHALLDAAERPIVIDDLSTGFEWAVPSAADLFTGDCGDQALLDKIIRTRKIDAVIHFAGSAILPESVSQPLRYYGNNTSKSRSLIEACVRHGVRNFIFSSTAAVYSTPGTRPIAETDATDPPSPYGRSKLMTEWMLRDAAAAYDLRFIALRYFNVAGADAQGRAGQSTRAATNLIKAAVQAAIGLRPHLDIFGDDYDTADGTGVRDFTHVSDLVAAHLAALKYLRQAGPSDILNCGYGRGYSVRDVVRAVEAATGQPLAVRNAPRRPGDLSQVIADNSRILRVLPWRPQYNDIDMIVATALKWEERLRAPLREPRLAAAG